MLKGPIQSSPTIGPDGTIYLGSEATVGDFYAISAAGAEKWEYDLGGSIFSSPAIGADGTIYVPAKAQLTAISPAGAEVRNWYLEEQQRASPAIGSDGTIYLGDDSGSVYAINPVTSGYGYVGFSTSFIMSSPAIGQDGAVYYGAGDGYLYASGTEVNTVPLEGISFAPANVPGGLVSTGTVTLTSTPPAGGDVVTLSSSNPTLASLVTPVTVTAAGDTATFSITTLPVQVDTPVTITASSGGISMTGVLTVKAPVPTNLALSPSSVVGSSSTVVTGTVTLSGPAPAGGVVVNLSSANTAAATVPSTLTIAAGGTSGTFTVQQKTVATSTTVAVTATLNSVSASANLTVTH